jgi:uncharacterized protein YjfI (DUF2170 family)
MSNNKLKQLTDELDNKTLSTGTGLTIELIDGDDSGEVSVAQILVKDREELPVYMTVDEGQILCITYLWNEREVKSGMRAELMDVLLTLNVSVPLSAFSKIGNQYIIYGALSPESNVNDVLLEIEVLSDNALEAIETVSEYLNEE